MVNGLFASVLIFAGGAVAGPPEDTGPPPSICLYADVCGVCGGDGSSCSNDDVASEARANAGLIGQCAAIAPSADESSNGIWREYMSAVVTDTFLSPERYAIFEPWACEGVDEGENGGLCPEGFWDALTDNPPVFEAQDPCSSVVSGCRLLDERACFEAFVFVEDIDFLAATYVDQMDSNHLSWREDAQSVPACGCAVDSDVTETPTSQADGT